MTNSDIEHMAQGYPPSHIGKDHEEVVIELASSVIELQQKLDAANEKLARYSMPAGQADQFAAEAKSVRKALGFAEDAQDVAPIDLLEKISGLMAEGVERFIHESAYEIPHRIKCGLMNYANQLRSGTHDTADKAG